MDPSAPFQYEDRMLPLADFRTFLKSIQGEEDVSVTDEEMQHLMMQLMPVVTNISTDVLAPSEVTTLSFDGFVTYMVALFCFIL